jgi:hypothetical protein
MTRYLDAKQGDAHGTTIPKPLIENIKKSFDATDQLLPGMDFCDSSSC